MVSLEVDRNMDLFAYKHTVSSLVHAQAPGNAGGGGHMASEIIVFSRRPGVQGLNHTLCRAKG